MDDLADFAMMPIKNFSIPVGYQFLLWFEYLINGCFYNIIVDSTTLIQIVHQCSMIIDLHRERCIA